MASYAENVSIWWRHHVHLHSRLDICFKGFGKDSRKTLDDGSTDCDLFPCVTAFRRRFISNFIFAHLNINSYRHKYIYIHDILAKKHVDYLAISKSKSDDSFPSAQNQTFWRTISLFFSDKKLRNGNHTTLREGESTIVDSGEVAEIFNAYFSNIAS